MANQKNEVKENKELKQRMLKEQKERIKNLRKFEQNRQETLKKMANQKKKLILEINKEDKNLYKTMLSQTHYKTEENVYLLSLCEQRNIFKGSQGNVQEKVISQTLGSVGCEIEQIRNEIGAKEKWA